MGPIMKFLKCIIIVFLLFASIFFSFVYAKKTILSDSNHNMEQAVDEKQSFDYSLYIPVINVLEKEYGEIRLIQSDYYTNNYASWEINGVCFLSLLDMDNKDGKELFAVCKNNSEDLYKGFIYTIKDEKAMCVFEIDDVTCSTNGGFFNITIIKSDNKDKVLSSPTTEDGSTTILYEYFNGGYEAIKYTCFLSYTSDSSLDSYFINDVQVNESEFENNKKNHGLSNYWNSEDTIQLFVRVLNGDYINFIKLYEEISCVKDSIYLYKNTKHTSEHSTVPESIWKGIYAELIIKDNFSKNDIRVDDTESAEKRTGYYLIFLDNDSIPELVINHNIHSEEMTLLSIFGNSVKEHKLLTDLRYLEKENIAHAHYMQMGFFFDIIYKLEEGNLIEIGRGEGKPEEIDNLMSYIYTWNGKNVSKETYNSHIESYIPATKAIVLPDSTKEYSYEEIIRYLTY